VAFAELRDGFGRSTHSLEGVAEAGIRIGIVGVERQRALEALGCFLVLALGCEDITQLSVESRGKRRDLDGTGEELYRLLSLALRVEGHRQEEECLGMVGLDIQNPPAETFRLLKASSLLTGKRRVERPPDPQRSLFVSKSAHLW
jgi:hypothetical protein